MTPKEKAKQIFDKMCIQTYSYKEYAGANNTIAEVGWEAGKKCALICVREITDSIDTGADSDLSKKLYKFWYSVQTELNNL